MKSLSSLKISSRQYSNIKTQNCRKTIEKDRINQETYLIQIPSKDSIPAKIIKPLDKTVDARSWVDSECLYYKSLEA